jgi:hypothetical protein
VIVSTAIIVFVAGRAREGVSEQKCNKKRGRGEAAMETVIDGGIEQ